ncbi:MAG: SRPBCC family protein [Dehalococcoidia bacterium]
MRHTISVTRSIDAPPAAVWSVLYGLPNWPRWDPYIVEMRRVDGHGGPHWRSGNRWNERVQRGPFRPTFRLTVSACRKGEALEWWARYLLVTATHRWTLRPQDGGCRITSAESFEGPAPLIVAARGLLRLFRVQRMSDHSMEALARAAEARAVGPSDAG